ncbi:MAG TPA: circadian clock KaiB family protein [Longimicrobiaceae bacterium]
MDPVRLTLYVAGDSLRSEQAIANLRRIVAAGVEGEARVSVVDVLQHPERAEAARILTTPTVVREAPAPARRVTGDLSDLRTVVAALGLRRPDSQEQG